MHGRFCSERATKKGAFDIASILKPTINTSYLDDTEDTSSDDGHVQQACPSPISSYSLANQLQANDRYLLSSSFESEQSFHRSPDSHVRPKSVARSEIPSKGKSKRLRTIFTSEQLERLEAEFEKQQYMVGHERLYVARNLDLSETQVKVSRWRTHWFQQSSSCDLKIWFQNRRIKWRRQTLDAHHSQWDHFVFIFIWHVLN